jgi:DNA-binding transcriptional regulator/RsmH inhibitor MraZ
MEGNHSQALWGEYERAVDEKGRVILPPVVRAAIGGAYRIVCQDGPCLRLIPVSPDSPDGIHIDPQGRVRLRAFYMRWVGLEPRDRVVVAVLGDSIEFWRKDTWTWFIKKTGQFEFDLDPEILRKSRLKD